MAEPSYERARPDHRPQAGGFRASEVECTVRLADRVRAGANLDCDSLLPNNEPAIAVDPVDADHAVIVSNDYDSCCGEFYTTFDGGATWRTGNLAAPGGGRQGSDPVVVVDPAHRAVIMASVSFATRDDGESADGHIIVSVSPDGGVTWGRPVIAAPGRGADDDRDQVFNDKPWLVTDSNPASPFYGRTYLVWARFRASYGRTRESPIWLASSDDGGRHWSDPKEISGADPMLCSGRLAGTVGWCAADQNPSPVVRSDGVLFVAFTNHQNESVAEEADGDDQYLVVRSDDGGATFSPPTQVVVLENGRDDYPRNAEGRPTLTGVQARVLFQGNLAVSPVTGDLVVAFADNRAGRRDGQPPVTDSNVYLMTSADGTRWRGPFPVATGDGDQWNPWVAVSPVDGTVGVLYLDGNVGGDGLYGVTLSEGRPGRLRSRAVAPDESDLRNSRFFPAGVRSCPRCTLFNGDYISLAYGPDGRAWAAWTDMRDEVTVRGTTGHAQRIFVATPTPGR